MSQNWQSGFSTTIGGTHLPPLKSKSTYHCLHAVNHPMRLLGYLNAAFPCGTFRTVKHEEREKWLGEKLRKSKEYEAKFGILAFTTALRVKEPNTSVRASCWNVSLGG